MVGQLTSMSRSFARHTLPASKRGHTSLLANMVLLAAMVAILVITLSRGSVSAHENIVIETLFAIIGIYATCEILCDKLPLSLNKMHWYFIFFFMSVAPLTHFLTGYAPGRYPLSDESIINGQLVALLWCSVYSIARRVKTSRRSSSERREHAVIATPSWVAPAFLLLSLISLAYMVLSLGGLSSLLTRGEAWLEVERPIDTVLGYLFRAIPVISFVILYRGKRYSGATYSWLYVSALVPIIVLLNYPVSLSRYWTAVVYIGLFASVAPFSWLGNRKFDLAIILGICIVFPLMYDLKFVDFETFLSAGVSSFFGSYEEVFNSMDFDAFTMLCRIIQYAGDYGLSLGRQLLSVVFFFVPRAVLPIKGQPTGSMVATAQGSSYTNLSAPIMGEGYIDFGLIGVVVYAVVLAVVIRSLDRSIFEDTNGSGSNTYRFLVGVFMLGFVIFLMRGALQPVFLRIMGFFLFLMIIFVCQRLASSQLSHGEQHIRLEDDGGAR